MTYPLVLNKLIFTCLLFILTLRAWGSDILPKYTVIEKNNLKGLSDTDGHVVIPPDYEDLGWSEGKTLVFHDRIGYKENGKWGLLNLHNEKVTEPRFTSLIPADENVLIAGVPDQYKLSELLGLVNYDGKPISGFYYNYLKKEGNYFIVSIRKSAVVNFGAINDKGKVTIPIKYKNFRSMGYDLYSFMDADKNVFLFHGNGNLVTRYSIDEVSPFIDNIALISRHGKTGAINTSGDIILPPAYKKIQVGPNGNIEYLAFRAWKVLSCPSCSRTYYYDSLRTLRPGYYVGFAGPTVNFIDSLDHCTNSYSDLGNLKIVGSEVIAKLKNRYGMLDSTGSVLYPFIYDSIASFPGYVLLKQHKDSETGWIIGNHWGDILNRGPFDKCYPVSKAYLLARRNGYWGIIFNDGKENINCIYDSIEGYQNGLLKVKFHNESGLLWKNNWLIYPGKYRIDLLDGQKIIFTDYRGSSVMNILGDTLYHSDNVLSRLSDFYLERGPDGRFGLISDSFKRILYPVYFRVTELPGDSLFVYNNENGWGALTRQGRVLFSNIKPMDSILSFSEGYFKVIIDGDYGFIDTNGMLRIANRYEDAGNFSNGIVPVKLLGHWGFVNKAEQLIIQPFYDQVNPYNRHVIVVCKKNKYGLIDNRGNSLLDMDYDSIRPAGKDGFYCTRNGMTGFIDPDGNMVITPRFDRLILINNGTFIATINNKYGVISSSGITVIPVVYDQMVYDKYQNQLWGCIKSEWQKF